MGRNLGRGVRLAISVAIFSLISIPAAVAETGAEGWLRYSQMKDNAAMLPGRVVVIGDGEVARTAGRELLRALGEPASLVPGGKNS